MAPRCKHCHDGVIVLLTGKGRVETTCSCERGLIRAQKILKAKLLDAYNERK